MSPARLASSDRPEHLPNSSRHAAPAVTLPAVALALAAFFAASSTAAQNLLTNPEFVGTVEPWTVCGVTSEGLLWDNRNEECTGSGSVLEGSAQVECNVGWGDSNQVAIRQCVPLAGTGIVPGSTAVYYSGWGVFSRDAGAFLSIEFFASADCSHSSILEATRWVSAPSFEWVPFELSPPSTVPEGAASIEYRLSAVDFVDSSTFHALLDDAYLGTVPLLFADGFEDPSQVPCAWSSYSP